MARQYVRTDSYEDEYTYLSLPVLKDPNSQFDWQSEGQCIKFPDLDFFSMESSLVRSRCKAVCATCVVSRQCLEFAQANDIRDGIWGGMTPKERRNHKEQQ